MVEKAIRLVHIENEVSIDKNTQSEFFFEYQKNILLTLFAQGVISDIQCQLCIEKLTSQFKKIKCPHIRNLF